jgi:hypothetical protein
MAKKRGRKASHRRTKHRVMVGKSAAASKTRMTSTNIRVILNNLIIFFILFLISLVLFSVLQSDVLVNLFFIFTLGFGFISVAFLITLLVFFFLKLFHMRRR